MTTPAGIPAAVQRALTAIDDAIGGRNTGGCRKCGSPLDGAPSDLFCSEDCQTLWLADRSSDFPTDGGQGPNEQLPEASPVHPLDWLGPAPPGHECPGYGGNEKPAEAGSEVRAAPPGAGFTRLFG